MSAATINTANGTISVATITINRDGVTEEIECVVLVDPISGAALSITPAGTNAQNALSIQGVQNGILVGVDLAGNGSTTGAPVAVNVLTGSTTVLNANAERLGFIVYNEGPETVYLAYGPTAAISGGYTVQMGPGSAQFIDILPWRGAVSAIVAAIPGQANTQSVILVTELNP